MLSIGKYNHGLYINGESHQSSICGGIITLIFAGFLLSIIVVVFRGILSRSDYSLDETIVTLAEEKLSLGSVTVGEFLATSLKLHGLQMFLSFDYGFTKCEDVILQAEYNPTKG